VFAYGEPFGVHPLSLRVLKTINVTISKSTF
jgi:hypothetical protein